MNLIYKLTNKINGKPYIGQTTRKIEKRWTEYKNLNCKGQPKLYRALKKYGWNNFLTEVIDTTAINQTQLDDLEIFYVAKFDSWHNGYNCDPGGLGGHKRKQSKETIEKRSGKNNPNFGKPLSEETKRKISEAKMGSKNAMFGKHISEEQKKIISETMKKRNNDYLKLPRSEEFKNKIKESWMLRRTASIPSICQR